MSKKFLLSTALVFALLAGKSIATENKPFEPDEVTSTALVVSPFPELPEETTTQVVSHMDVKSFTNLALTSKDNYRLAEKTIQYFRPDLKLNCFGSEDFNFYNPIASYWIRTDLEKKAKNGDYKNTENSHIPLRVLLDICEISNTRDYFITSEIENMILDWKEYSRGGEAPTDVNFHFSKDLHILVSYVRASNKIYPSTEGNLDIISNYVDSQKKLPNIEYPLRKYYFEKEVEVLGLQLSKTLGIENSHSEIMAHPEVQKYLLEEENSKKKNQDVQLRLLEIQKTTNSQVEFLAHPEVQAEIQDLAKEACAIM
ncbi:MAG: F-box protein [Janthinobacterium lividum]